MNKFINTIVAVSAATMMLAVVAVPAPAQAQTIAELQAQISALMAQISALTGSTTTTGGSSYTFTRDLTIGSSGTDVMELQKFLNGKGFAVSASGAGSAGQESTYFGALTASALARYQAANNIAPAVGYFGPMTRANVNATGGSTTPDGDDDSDDDSTDDGDLEGDFGTISDVDELGSYSDEEVGEGQEGVTVLGADIEASNDGDISLTAVKVSFDSTGNTGSDNLDDYISAVTIMLGDEEVGSADVDDFNENGAVWSRTISLDGAKISSDDTEKLYVVVDAASTFDSSDIGSADSWTVDIDSIKFVDGSDDSTTDTSTGDIDGMDVPVDFVSFSAAADTELKITTDSDSPEAGIIVVDDSSDTDDVSLLKGNLELEGDSDGVLDEFPITFTATTGGTANGIDDIAGSVTLIIDGQEFTETMSVSAALVGTVTFDNLDLDLTGDETVEFEVLADVNDLDGTVFAAGSTLKADVTSTNRDYMDVENEEGDQLSDSSEKSGTASGEAQEFRVSGIQLDLVSTNTSVAAGDSSNDDAGTFTIKFKVTAVGDTIYVSSLADATTGANTDGKTSVNVDRSGVATTGGVSVVLTNVDDDDLTSVGLYEIEEGDSNTFELTTAVQLSATQTTGLFRAVLGGVRWTTTSTDATPSNSYTSNLDEFKTSYVNLN